MMRKCAYRFSGHRGLPLMKEDRLEGPEALRQLAEPQGRQPHVLHDFMAARCQSRWRVVRQWAREMCSLRRIAVETPRVEYPCIASNSQWLYHASDRLTILRWLRSAELPLVVYVLAFSQLPAVVGLAMFFFYHFGLRAVFYEQMRRVSVRMDYLPGQRLVSVAKLSWNGRVQNTLWRLEDFERVSTRKELELLGAVWKVLPMMDMDLMYRNRRTGELLCFDKTGVWNWEGLSHPDLNVHGIPLAKE